MSVKAVLDGAKGFFTRKKAGTGSHTGLLYGGIVFLISMLMMLAGFLNNLDTALNAIVFQMGYQPPKAHDQLIVVKKDQATSALLGKNPERAEFASIFRFLGQSQVVARKFASKPRSIEILRVHIGFFPGLKELPVRMAYTDWCGIADKEPASAGFNVGRWNLTSHRVKDFFKNNPEHPGFNSLIKIEGRTWPPTGPSLIKLMAGGSEPLILPSLLVNWNDPELLKTLKNETSPEKMPEQHRAAAMLLERWQNLLANLGSFNVGIDFKFFPRPGTVLSMTLSGRTDGLPAEYIVEPAAAIGFDFVLQGGKDKELDKVLQRAIKKSQSPIILAGHTKIEEEFVYEDSDSKAPTRLDKLSNTRQAVKQILPDPSFLKGKSRMAFIDMAAGNKSYVTEVPLYVVSDKDKRLEPTFSLLIAMLALDARKPGEKPGYVEAMDLALASIYDEVVAGRFKGPLIIKDLTIPVNSYGRMLLDYVGSTSRGRFDNAAIRSASFFECFDERTLASYSLLTPEESRLKPEFAHRNTLDLQQNKGGKIAIAGPFEVSDFDYFPTPLTYDSGFAVQKEPLMGIEIHANAILNITEQRYLKHPSYVHTVIALLVSTLLLGFLLDILSPVAGAFVMAAFVAGSFWHAYSSYHIARQLFNFSSLVISYPTIWSLATLTNYLRQRARAQSTKEMFSRFVAADVVQYMLDNPELVKPGGEKVELTIFFSDVAGFTSISEALTPEELVVLLNEYLGAMTDLLFEYGGTLDKFIGDAVMAFWNFPQKQEDHSVRGCLCALAMQRKIHELQLGWAKRGLPKVSARAGLNTADVVVGYMGSQKAQMNFTCMGDGVNLASRLEGANKEYGTALMISDAVYQRAKHVVSARFLDFLAVKGKKEPVKVFELVSEKGKEPPGWFELIELYDRAIQLHLDRHWDEAIATFKEILDRWPDDGPSATYIHRCQEYKDNPPPEGWDGRYILTHK